MSARPIRRAPAALLPRLLRVLAVALALAAAPALGPLEPPAAQTGGEPVEALDGRFVGIGSADGMRLEIDAARDPSGRFVDSNGREVEIGGGWRGGGLEALLNFPGRPVWARFDPAPLGVQMTVLPLDPDGRPLEAEARRLAFVREGTPLPEQPDLYMDPPKRADGESDPDVFLASYQFWPPEGVYNGFTQIGARYRTMIRFVPQVHADVLWKLCDAPQARELVAESLRGQGATCQEVTNTVARLQTEGRFAEWKAAVDRAIEGLMPAVQCARGYVVKESVCAPAAKKMAEAAVSMETVGSVLSRWR